MTRLFSSALIFSSAFFLTVSAFAKTIVIADIDDTLRNFHSQGNYIEMYDNATDSDRAFRGMSQVLNDLSENGAEIHYVSAVVEPFTGLSKDFLEDNHFPQAENFSGKGWFQDTTDFKVSEIETILTGNVADDVVFLGDNGDHDVEVYQRLAAEFSNTHTYIHKLYVGDGLMTLAPGQDVFITAADLAVRLENLQALTPEQTALVLQNIVSDASSDEADVREMLWPSWAQAEPQDISAAFTIPSATAGEAQALRQIQSALFP